MPDVKGGARFAADGTDNAEAKPEADGQSLLSDADLAMHVTGAPPRLPAKDEESDASTGSGACAAPLAAQPKRARSCVAVDDGTPAATSADADIAKLFDMGFNIDAASFAPA